MARFSYVVSIFLSSFLLFLVQPIVARELLPWFGGSAGVWTVCLLFFQAVLVLGYLYSHVLTRRLEPRTQRQVHTAFLAVTLLSLPIVASSFWKPADTTAPIAHLLLALAATVGAPCLALSTTTPLLQSWFTHAFPALNAYRLFALSNLGAIAALMAYPFLIEPAMTSTSQAIVWSIAYAAFAVSAAVAARQSTASRNVERDFSPGLRTSGGFPRWFALAAAGTWLLAAVTQHVSQNLAAIPFLWIVPLAAYLTTFVLCFGRHRPYRRSLWATASLVMLVVCANGLQTSDAGLDIVVAVPLWNVALFTWCMFCHGELARLRPEPDRLTHFYLAIALGGMTGTAIVAIVAPLLVNGPYELGIGLTFTAALIGLALKPSAGFRPLALSPALAALSVVLFCAFSSYRQIVDVQSATRLITRNFFGVLRVSDDPRTASRKLVDGIVLHGEQFQAADRRREPTTYYGAGSAIGTVLGMSEGRPRRVGVVGLGAGTLASYGQKRDVFRFYELNPSVVDIARREFTFLGDSAASIEIAIGDGRLLLEREPPQGFDALVLDAFSSDAIPVHLLTSEAVALYQRHIKPDGLIAVHVTNRFLDLAPVLITTARSLGLDAELFVDATEDDAVTRSDWVLISPDAALLEAAALTSKTQPPSRLSGLRPWTDQYHNLFRILRDVHTRQGS